MTKYKIGDWVKVVCEKHKHQFAIGNIVTIIGIDEDCKDTTYYAVDNKNHKWWITESEITPASEPEPEITVNGAVYILKPEPEHVWKFGDWARITQPENTYFGQVCFVLGGVDNNGWLPVSFIGAAGRRNTDGVRPNVATYISTAEIPA